MGRMDQTHPKLAALKEQLMALPWGEIRALAEETKLPASTIDKIRRGLSEHPSYNRVQHILDVLEAKAAQ